MNLPTETSSLISDNYIDQISKNGYVVLKSAISIDEIEMLKREVTELWETEDRPDPSTVPRLNTGHSVLYNLEWKKPSFLRAIIRQKVVLDVLKFFLNDVWYKQIPQDLPNFILRAMIARSGGPSTLPLHIDSFVPSPGDFPLLMQVAVILEDQDVQNGCTFCLPGSHKWGRYADNSSDVKTLVPIPSKAGDLVIWDSRLHHGAFANKTESTRWSIVATFSRWFIKQNYQTHLNLSPEFKANLTQEEKIILGLCSIPPIDAFDRIDIKAGLEIL